MQIIIVQAEIETAIRNFITSQINLREGQNITVDLTATRGESGFKAVIDIASATATPVVVSIPVQPTPAPTMLAIASNHAAGQAELPMQPKTATEMRQALEAEYEAEAKKEKEAEVVTEEKVETPAAEVTATEAPNEPTTAALAATAETTAEAGKPRAAFGGLFRPKNTPAAGS